MRASASRRSSSRTGHCTRGACPGEVRPRHTGAAHAVADVQVHGTDTLGLGDVHVVEVGHPIGPTGVHERGRHRVEIPGALDADRAARAAECTRPALPVLRFLEQGQDGVEIPAGIAGLRPGVVVGPVAAGPRHGIDASRSAEHLAERQGDGATIDVRARFVAVGPVVSRADVLDPLRWIRDAVDAFVRCACLEQEDGGVGAVQQATRDHATRRPRADDHVVVTSGEHLAAPGLTRKLNHSRSLSGRPSS
jgi:hypothetical protein